jgi:hypothetical protein
MEYQIIRAPLYSVLEFEVQSSLVFQGIFKLLGIWNPKDFSLLKLVQWSY